MTASCFILFFCSAPLLFAGLFIAAYADIKTRMIPNFASLFVLSAGIPYVFADGFSFHRLLAASLGALVGGFPLFIMALCRDSVGGGDVKLAASTGFALGWVMSYLALMTALLAFVFYGCFIQQKKGKNAPSLPFAPFYAAAATGAFIVSALLRFSSVHISIF